MRVHFLVMCIGLSACATDRGPETSVQAANNCPPDNPNCCHTPESPIIFDLLGNGLQLTSPENGVLFTMRRGDLGQWAWTAADGDDAFLVLDRNENGVIDDGAEMFGNLSPQAPSDEPNGFAALAWFDVAARGGNGDQTIDARDGVWRALLLWRDANHNGISETREFTPLSASGVSALPLGTIIRADRRDEHGNDYRFSAPIVARAPIAQFVTDVWLARGAAPADAVDQYQCEAWVYAFRVVDGMRDACMLPAVASDPIVAYQGNIVRQVVRGGTRSTNSSTAANAAIREVNRAVGFESTTPPTAGCWWDFGDTNLPDPYLDTWHGGISFTPERPSPAALPRYWCTRLRPTGGGGGSECPLQVGEP